MGITNVFAVTQPRAAARSPVFRPTSPGCRVINAMPKEVVGVHRPEVGVYEADRESSADAKPRGLHCSWFQNSVENPMTD